jgi:hypothetical protein
MVLAGISTGENASTGVATTADNQNRCLTLEHLFDYSVKNQNGCANPMDVLTVLFQLFLVGVAASVAATMVVEAIRNREPAVGAGVCVRTPRHERPDGGTTEKRGSLRTRRAA